MSAFKNLLKSDTPTSGEAGRSSGLRGQGSHFPKEDDSPLASRAADADLGSTVTGTEPHTAGPSDTSAAPAPVSQAQATAGPEAGGTGHVGTVSAADATQPSTTDTSTTHSFPKTLRSTPATEPERETGTAAVGQTTTYSSQPLASGDPTGSVVDHQSTDPLTYKLPEAGSATSPTSSPAVTSSAAATAASTAWSTHNKSEQIPGAYPSSGNENPYRASNLDPRVDGGKLGSSTAQQPSSDLPTRTRDSDLGTATGVGAGASAGALAASQSSARDATAPYPSALTSTTDPADRSAEYSTSASTKVPDSSIPAATESQTGGEQQSVVGKALGALGLGGAASAAAGYLGYGAKGGAETDEPRDTSAIATQPGVVAQETGPPKHYRRESIPTTAYPGGVDSPRAVAPPIGGTADARRSVDQGPSESGTGTSATAGAATGLGLGAATSGVGRQEYSDSSNLRDTIGGDSRDRTGDSTTTDSKKVAEKIGHPGTATADAIDAGAFPLRSTNKEAELVGNVDKDPATVGGPAGTSSQPGDTSARGAESSHTGRDVAAGGAAAAAAAGAGAYGLQHHRKSDDLRSSAAEDASREKATTSGSDTLSGGHSYTITGGENKAPVDAISSRDPNDSATASRGIGSSTSPDAPIDAVAAAPGRYEGQDYKQSDTIAPERGSLARGDDDDSHTGRNAALGAGAAAGVGGLAYAASDRGNQESIHDQTTVASPTGPSTTTDPSYDATSGTTTGTEQAARRDHDDHTGRNVAAGAAAGAAAGGAAYAAQDRSHERELEKQREADAKEAAKREKEHQKELEKEEKHRQKELEKEEKHKQKELEKEEKHKQKELEKEEKQKQKEAEKEAKEEQKHAAEAEKREQARLAAEEEDRKRREREAAAGVGAAGGAATVAGHQEEKKEKKPSIFKRIFKRRKNKDTGEDEDYSTDDEDDKAAHAAAAAGTGTAAGSSIPHHESESKGRNVLGHGSDKDAYREHPAWKGPVTDVAAENSYNTPGRPHPGAEERLGREPGTTTAGTEPSPSEGGAAAITGATAAGAGTAAASSTQDNRPVEPTTGMPYDPSKDPAAAARLEERSSVDNTLGTATGTGLSSSQDTRPVEPTTGMPYDPAKDPAAAARIEGRSSVDDTTGTAAGTGGSSGIIGAGPLGEIGDHRR